MTINDPLSNQEPSIEAKLWVISQISRFIHDTKGDGTYRTLIYDYLNFNNYHEPYEAGAMVITNSISKESYEEYVDCVSCKK